MAQAIYVTSLIVGLELMRAFHKLRRVGLS